MIQGIPTPADLFFAQIRRAIEKVLKDGLLTEYWSGIRYRGDVAKYALRHSRRSKVAVYCAGFDITNVGGANAEHNWTWVAEHVFKPYARFFSEALAETLCDRAQFLLFRQGGDEFCAIVVGIPGKGLCKADIERALEEFKKRVRAYSRAMRLDRIRNPKHPKDRGVGVVCACAQLLRTGRGISGFGEVDELIEEGKKKRHKPGSRKAK